MIFTKLLQKLKKKASSKKEATKKKPVKKLSSERNLQFDLFAQLSYMASVATAGVSRSELFNFASLLPYSSSAYFRRIHLLAQKVNIDYAEGCRLVAERTKLQDVKSLLLRLAGSLSSGEEETEFLAREAEHVAAVYGNQYERDVESLKKWEDAYVTLVVAAGLIVIVSIISMMIYEVGVAIIIGLAVTMVFVTCLGAWIIYASSPREIKTRVQGYSSIYQIRASMLLKTLGPLAVMLAALMVLMKVDLGWILLMGSAMLFPAGYYINKDDKRVSSKDNDLPTVVRVLGAVTSAIGTTVTEALGEVDRRSMGALMPEMTILRYRLLSGINPRLCWSKVVDESGSELVERTITMFYDAMSLGGDAGKIGFATSFYSSKIAFLRATRSMVASTFRWLVFPLHVSMVGLLIFIPQVMGLFTQSINNSADTLAATSGTNLPNSSMPIGDIFSFGQVNLELINILVTLVVLVLTMANSYAPKAADGGSNIKFFYNLAIMMALTGLLLLIIPVFATSLFESITEA
jgi:flagellar protein FlaJ